MPGTHIAAPIVCGLACIVLGVIPGLLSGLKDGVANGLQNVYRPFPPHRPHHRAWPVSENRNERIGFVMGGVAFLLLAAFAAFSR